MDDSRMLSIKEFSQFTGLSEHTLRYYDKIGLLCPTARGSNKYRYYTPPQALIACFIATLSRLDVPLAIIRELNESRTPQKMLELLERQQQVLISQIFDLQTAYAITQAHRGNIQAGLFAHDCEIDVRALDETRMALGPPADFDDEGVFFKSFMDFCDMRDENKYYPIGGYYKNINTFLNDTSSQPTGFFALDPRGDDKREAGQYLVAHHRGLYRDFGDLPQRILAYARENKLSFRGPAYLIYLVDEICERDATRYLAQLTVRVDKSGQTPQWASART